MEIVSLVLSVVSTVGLGLLLLIWRSYLPAYLNEKGKNLASKEDVAHLTDLVEKVKASYLADLEQLKATYLTDLERLKASHSADLEHIKASLLSDGQVTERRRQIYVEICKSMQVFVDGNSATKEDKENFTHVYSLAYLWASDNVVRSLNTFVNSQIAHSSHPNDYLKHTYATVIDAMRKDVGHADTQIAINDHHIISFGSSLSPPIAAIAASYGLKDVG